LNTILYIDESGAFGGAITCMAQVIRNLDRERFRPVVILHHDDPILRDRIGDVPIYVLRRRRIGAGPIGRPLQRFLIKIFGHRGARWFALGQTALGYVFDVVPRSAKIRSIAQEHSVDLVHTNNSLEINWAGILAAHRMNLPSIAHVRSFERAGRTQKRVFGMVDHILVQSHAQKEQLVADGLPADAITVAHETVSDEEIRSANESGGVTRPRTYGITGMLVPWKGHRTFLAAAAIVKSEISEAKALIYGDETPMNPGYRRDLEDYAASVGLGDSVEFRGLAKDIQTALGEIDILVHASDEPEPFGRVLVEAMAAGKPVIAANAGGPREIVADGETGILFEPGSPESLAAAIRRLLQDQRLRQRMGEAGRERVMEHFHARQQVEQVQRLYEEVLSRKVTDELVPETRDPS
jgi:glycosyltransferase involved in cell wall biosynthesis